MNNLIQDYHRTPTYAELFQEASIHPTETIKHPNRTATQNIHTPQLQLFDDEESIRCKHFKLQYYEAKYTTDCGPKSNATSSTSN